MISTLCAVQVQMIQAAAAIVDPHMRNYYRDPNKLVLTVAEFEAPQQDFPAIKLAVQHVVKNFRLTEPMGIIGHGIGQASEVCSLGTFSSGYCETYTTNLESVYIGVAKAECIKNFRRILLEKLRSHTKFHWKLWTEEEKYVARIPIFTFERKKNIVGKERRVEWLPAHFTLKTNLFKTWENVNFGKISLLLLQLTQVGDLKANSYRSWRTLHVMSEYVIPIEVA